MGVFINTIEQEFASHENSEIAAKQKAYMKGHFSYFGLTSPVRKTLQHPFLIKKFLPPKTELNSIIKELWQKPEREFQYFGQELAFKYHTQFAIEDISLFEFMITQKSWWDSVDFIAVNILGSYFKKFPIQQKPYVDKWLRSNNIWLQRSAIIYQLKYKQEVDQELLSYAIRSLVGSKEFFINKAIGWALRQYGKFNPTWVIEFTNNTDLSNLSNKEALRLIKS